MKELWDEAIHKPVRGITPRSGPEDSGCITALFCGLSRRSANCNRLIPSPWTRSRFCTSADSVSSPCFDSTSA
eukprot:2037298-Prymnesium_polylepis.1